MKSCLFFIALVASFNIRTQNLTNQDLYFPAENHASQKSGNDPGHNVRIVFYNAENLYDPYNDTLTQDDEFTASGSKHWSYTRFQQKLNHVAKTLLAAGGVEPPGIIGICEVENKYVLNRLIYQTPLKKFRYRIIHHDSPDFRGVDVALIYRPERFSVLSWRCIRINYPFDATAQTREILMVKGKVFQCDTVILFVNHWPSRRGGYLASQPKRNYVANVLKSVTDSIFSNDPSPGIIIMGDFNDTPECISLSGILGARPYSDDIKPEELINLMHSDNIKWHKGTIRYQGEWSVFDQFIVSGNLVSNDRIANRIHAEAHIFKGDFLVEHDDRYLGEKLKRTYAGPKYLGGFSDHLPVYLDLVKVNEDGEMVKW